MRKCNAESQNRSRKDSNFLRRRQSYAPLGVITREPYLPVGAADGGVQHRHPDREAEQHRRL